MSGLRYITGYEDQAPVRIGISLADELAALYGVVGIQAALVARERDGVGDYVDISLLESSIAVTQGMLPEYDALGIVRERSGNSHNAVAPSNIYPTRDGKWIAIGANTNSLFRRFVAAIGPAGAGRRAALPRQPRAHRACRRDRCADRGSGRARWTATRLRSCSPRPASPPGR